MKEIILNLVFCTLGAFLAAFALECFLVPNQIIDGGVVGISIMASYITKINLGIFLVALNLPFLFMAWNEFGKKFIFLALYSVAMLAIFVNVTHHIPVITKDLLLSALFGGGILGTGVGLVLKNNACMDLERCKLCLLSCVLYGFDVVSGASQETAGYEPSVQGEAL